MWWIARPHSTELKRCQAPETHVLLGHTGGLRFARCHECALEEQQRNPKLIVVPLAEEAETRAAIRVRYELESRARLGTIECGWCGGDGGTGPEACSHCNGTGRLPMSSALRGDARKARGL